MQFTGQIMSRFKSLIKPNKDSQPLGAGIVPLGAADVQELLHSQIGAAAPIEQFSPLHALVNEIQDAADQDADSFFRAVDQARLTFARAVGDDLRQALTGVKMANLLVAQYEYNRGHVVTVGQPISFMLDTANQCQLGCPSCTNTFNREFAEATYNPWPRGLLSADRFNAFIRSVGVSAFAGHFYNNNEPFLNKRATEYLRVANDLQIETFVSSNLSFSKMDHEAIVRSGLNELMVAADGLTQESYEKYRKGGKLEWVFANVRGIADAKKRLGMATPTLRWQWLTFAHNVHQVEEAIPFAREIGFDTFNLATPHEVSQDDPNVHAVEYEGPEEHRAVVFNPRVPGSFESDLEPYRDLIEEKLEASLHQQWVEAGGPAAVPKDPDSGDRCDWLHMAVISDAMGRVVPCCIGDYKGSGNFIFATVDAHHDNLLNSPLYQKARLLISQPDQYAIAVEGQGEDERSRCETCPMRPTPQIGLGAVNSYFAHADNPAINALPQDLKRSLVTWSRHQPMRPKRPQFAIAFDGEVEPRYHNSATAPTPGHFLGFASGHYVSHPGVQLVHIQFRIDGAADLAEPGIAAILLDEAGTELASVDTGPLEPVGAGRSRWYGVTVTMPYLPGLRRVAFSLKDAGATVESEALLQLRCSLGGALRVVSLDPADPARLVLDLGQPVAMASRAV